MAFTTADLTKIESAIAKGELEVVFDGKQVKYRSITELKAARDLIRGELEASGALSPAKSVSYSQFTRD